MKTQHYNAGKHFVTSILEGGFLKKVLGLRKKVQGGEVKGSGILGSISKKQAQLNDIMKG